MWLQPDAASCFQFLAWSGIPFSRAGASNAYIFQSLSSGGMPHSDIGQNARLGVPATCPSTLCEWLGLNTADRKRGSFARLLVSSCGVFPRACRHLTPGKIRHRCGCNQMRQVVFSSFLGLGYLSAGMVLEMLTSSKASPVVACLTVTSVKKQDWGCPRLAPTLYVSGWGVKLLPTGSEARLPGS